MSSEIIESENIDSFWSRMRLVSDVLQDMDKKLSKNMAHRFNIFNDIFQSAINENKISDIIAWLLNPKETHGQGDLFLRLFMQELQLESLIVTEQINIFREKMATTIESSSRRLDIVIFGDEWVVGIENKPWAIEQENQISDYQLYLSRICKKCPIIVFIAGYNLVSSTVDKSSRTKFIELRYVLSDNKVCCGTLANWINNCLIFCTAESVRWFLRQFFQYIENNF